MGAPIFRRKGNFLFSRKSQNLQLFLAANFHAFYIQISQEMVHSPSKNKEVKPIKKETFLHMFSLEVLQFFAPIAKTKYKSYSINDVPNVSDFVCVVVKDANANPKPLSMVPQLPQIITNQKADVQTFFLLNFDFKCFFSRYSGRKNLDLRIPSFLMTFREYLLSNRPTFFDVIFARQNLS